MCLGGTPFQIDCKLSQRADFLHVGLFLSIVKIPKLILRLLPLLGLGGENISMLPNRRVIYAIWAIDRLLLGSQMGTKSQIFENLPLPLFMTFKKATFQWIWWRWDKKKDLAFAGTLFLPNFRDYHLNLGQDIWKKIKYFEKVTFLCCYKCFNLKSLQRKIYLLETLRYGKTFYARCASEAHTRGE